MYKYSVRMVQQTTWEFEVEAESEEAVDEMIWDWGRDELNESDITDNMWETHIMELGEVKED